MKAFASLLDRLSFVRSRKMKIALIRDYLAATPDPDRGYALAALAGELDLKTAKPAMIRELAATRADPELFRLSYDYVGDLAETVALIWPDPAAEHQTPALSHVVAELNAAKRKEVPDLIWDWLDGLAAEGRWALLKLITGGLRVGVSARLARTALAELGEPDVDDIEEVWHALEPPYTGLFDWIEGRAERPSLEDALVFRPLMLAHPLDEANSDRIAPEDFRAEWKWDGIRVQLVLKKGVKPGCFPAQVTTYPVRFRPARRNGRRSRGRWRTSGHAGRRDRDLQRASATAEPQDRYGEDAGGSAGRYPPL